MQFETPDPGITFEIPDHWWVIADMVDFKPPSAGFYTPSTSPFEVIELNDVEPPRRSPGVALFKKYKLIPVLFALQSPECKLPLVQVVRIQAPKRYRFIVQNGVHRFYASVAAGFSRLPVQIYESDELYAL